MIGPSSTLPEVAFAVCTALDRAGFTVVLTGGSAATFYAPDAYQSDDLDFVITLNGKNGDEALESLGYRKKGDFYVHDSSRYPIEFPPGPLAVGDDQIKKWSTVKRRSQLLHVLTPTDSVRDRLASFLFWKDYRGLEQAIAVAKTRAADVDLKLVEDWCRREGQPEKFELFRARLASE